MGLTEWCAEPCPGSRRRMYGKQEIVQHVHSECWQCGTPIVHETSSYECGECGCGGGLPFTTHTPAEYDPETARDRSGP